MYNINILNESVMICEWERKVSDDESTWLLTQLITLLLLTRPSHIISSLNILQFVSSFLHKGCLLLDVVIVLSILEFINAPLSIKNIILFSGRHGIFTTYSFYSSIISLTHWNYPLKDCNHPYY